MNLVDYQKSPNTIKINVYSTNKKGIYDIRCDGGGGYCYHFKNHFRKANMYCTLCGYFVPSLSSRRWRSAGVCDIIIVLRLNLRGI